MAKKKADLKTGGSAKAKLVPAPATLTSDTIFEWIEEIQEAQDNDFKTLWYMMPELERLKCEMRIVATQLGRAPLSKKNIEIINF